MPKEYAFLLRGGIVLDRENQPDKPVPWLPDETWDNITELDNLPGFHGIISSFEQYPRDWNNWCGCSTLRYRYVDLSTWVSFEAGISRLVVLWEYSISVI